VCGERFGGGLLFLMLTTPPGLTGDLAFRQETSDSVMGGLFGRNKERWE